MKRNLLYQLGLHLLLLTGLLVGLSNQSNATHIVGGEISYKCLGNDDYEITLRVYRDCFNGVPAFDSPALLDIFDAQNEYIKTLNMPFLGSDTLDPTLLYPCIDIPTNICVEKTIYVATVSLPPIPGGYQLAYQRCCRNKTILNIINPNNTGSTYTINIPDTSVLQCGSSPYFVNFPPVFICVNEPLVFDHSAFDPEGDSIVYEICTPFVGASTNEPTTGTVKPPPPFEFVTWKAPYLLANPLGGVPLAIDRNTGLLTATPNTVGQFVVGVCAYEYRDGVLLSVNKRDFQFNVRPCGQPMNPDFSFKGVCESDTIDFTNLSTNSTEYFWDFGDSSELGDTSRLESPSYSYTDEGTYTITLVTSNDICYDTIQKTVDVYDRPEAAFEIAVDSCTNEVVVTNTTTGGDSYVWDFGNGETDTALAPYYLYREAGTYTIKVVAKHIVCLDTAEISFEIPKDFFDDVTIPNVFTPNDDGINDFFRIQGIDHCEDYELEIYNRWGEVMYRHEELQEDWWDGTFNNVLSSAGVYYYIFRTTKRRNPIERTGTITVIRGLF